VAGGDGVVSVVTRRVAPRVVTALARVDGPARAGARARRALGRSGVLELYFAFDDPCSAVAVVDLAARLDGYDVALALRPVVARGIVGDPAVQQKRAHALLDARRLAARSGRTLGRDTVVAPEDVAFLARWVATADTPSHALTAFCVGALGRLWLMDPADGGGELDPDGYAALWRATFDGAEPPALRDEDPVARNEHRMARRKMYDVPAAWCAGRWWFAHDRPAQVVAWLDALGWGPR
jgi:2-hydroxychromene-2-carboxylate isomerase